MLKSSISRNFQPGRCSYRAIGAVGLVFVLLLAGCRTSAPVIRQTRAWHGQTPVMASFQFGKLTTDLPPGTQVETVMVVARSMLHRQGHTIESFSASPQGGRLVALAGGANTPYEKIKLKATFEGSTVMLQINLDPADENRSRMVFESLLAELGM